jgi:transposase
MPRRLKLSLSSLQRLQLEDLRDHHQKPYLRERAAAVLKVADGLSAQAVSADGLLRKRAYQTICQWVHRFQTHGSPGLFIHPGRGRKPALPP